MSFGRKKYAVQNDVFLSVVNVLFYRQRQSYYEDLFIANKGDVDRHMNKIYAKQSKSKVCVQCSSYHSILSL